MIGTGAGTKQYFSDAELAGYKRYRDNVLQYVRSCNDVLFEKEGLLKETGLDAYSSEYTEMLSSPNVLINAAEEMLRAAWMYVIFYPIPG